jgi:hypothetical protein
MRKDSSLNRREPQKQTSRGDHVGAPISSDLSNDLAVLLAGDTSRQHGNRTDFAVTARLQMERVSATVAPHRSSFARPC